MVECGLSIDTGNRSKSEKTILSMKPKTFNKAVRLKCLECTVGSRSAVRECETTSCPLHAFRMGKNPYIKPRNPRGNSESLQKYRESR